MSYYISSSRSIIGSNSGLEIARNIAISNLRCYDEVLTAEESAIAIAAYNSLIAINLISDDWHSQYEIDGEGIESGDFGHLRIFAWDDPRCEETCPSY